MYQQYRDVPAFRMEHAVLTMETWPLLWSATALLNVHLSALTQQCSRQHVPFTMYVRWESTCLAFERAQQAAPNQQCIVFWAAGKVLLLEKFGLTAWLQDSTMPDTLGSVCNNIRFANAPANSSEHCQGFVYDAEHSTAFFKVQPRETWLGTKNLCSSPTTYTWLRTLGQLHCMSTLHIHIACLCSLHSFACLLENIVGTAWHSLVSYVMV